MKIAVVGAGVAGLAMARLLRDECAVVVFEANDYIGGLIHCEKVKGSLFHCCGGHVFNTKNEKVLKWFWSLFDRERMFRCAERNAVIAFPERGIIPYPIENHLYMLDDEIQRAIVSDLLTLADEDSNALQSFDDFLQRRFGKTLYELYFRPYNEKIWRCDLAKIPLDWLQGKLPMPSVKEIVLANFARSEERTLVHSSFYYPKDGGSQFIADELAKGSDIRLNSPVREIVSEDVGLRVNGEHFDAVVYCGNLRYLPGILRGMDWGGYDAQIDRLMSHGTTTAFCEVKKNPYTWIYQPDGAHDSHRIICTGNFSPLNDGDGHFTASVEFTDCVSEPEIRRQLQLMPFSPSFLASTYNQHTYPIQDSDTTVLVRSLKSRLRANGIHLVGRFAEWEYMNMDAVIASAMDCVPSVLTR